LYPEPAENPTALGYDAGMPTVLNTNGMRVVVYPGDHRPAHVHVMGADFEVVLTLNCPDGPIELRNIGAGKVTRTRIEKIRRSLVPHLTDLCFAWRKHHGHYH
jgi:hypothetical protein